MEVLIEAKSSFGFLLLKWYEKNGRRFPWREKRDPYQILIAEIMLQRTRADQVAPVYLDFVRELPTIEDLKTASVGQVRRYFVRLGLLWRAKRVKQMADDIIQRFNGKIPQNRDQLLSIPSVGDYMADAVLAFAYGKDVAVVDSNVCRVVGRVFGLDWKKEARRKLVFREIPGKLLPKGKAREFNWAIIDLGSVLCSPNNPLCWKCPLNRICNFSHTLGYCCKRV
jgi:A/G-specific adenine glycosylase